MIPVRNFEEIDSVEIGRLIAKTYGEFNLSFASPEERLRMLGPFRLFEAYRSKEPLNIICWRSFWIG